MREHHQPSLPSPLDPITTLQNNCPYSEFAEQVTYPQLVSGQTKFKPGLSKPIVILVLTNQWPPSNMTTLWKSQALSHCAPSLLAKHQDVFEKFPRLWQTTTLRALRSRPPSGSGMWCRGWFLGQLGGQRTWTYFLWASLDLNDMNRVSNISPPGSTSLWPGHSKVYLSISI